uniref:Uncharacterized protein n=1 Tax=Kalanchoe fedtschenkoi TaxID=63787 RepID=A0A7N0RIV5_KALFE
MWQSSKTRIMTSSLHFCHYQLNQCQWAHQISHLAH